nr:Crp/Fnr family transcriptional regulator [uncultured Noviherbaspirillum sp.]
MSYAEKSRPTRGSYFLSRLSDDDYADLLPSLELIQLDSKQIVHERNKPFADVYFPTTCMISAVLPMLDGAAVEVGTVGNEGLSAVEMVAGAVSPINTFMCQIPGHAMRMSVTDFKHALKEMPELRQLAFGYLQCYMAQMAQSAACNSQHAVEARFARWMLVTHDRVEGDDFRLTQEFMAQMLGVHRPSVSLIANQFQAAGLLQYSRGLIRILNREGIEEVCCECYAQVRDRFQSVMGVERGG